jgi:glucosylceramidase
MNRTQNTITTVGLALLLAACSSSSPQGGSGGSGAGGGGSGGAASGGTTSPGGSNAGGNATAGASGSARGGAPATGGSTGPGGSGAGGKATAGASGSGSGGATANGGSTGPGGSGAAGNAAGGTTSNNGGATTTTPSGGSTNAGGAVVGGSQGTGGDTTAAGGTTAPSTALVTSASGAYWKTGTWTDSTSSATVTVNDTSVAQTWDGFGGAFNELGWSALTSKGMQDQAVQLLFSATDGANFAWGRIPIGASDYAVSRYTLDDTGDDVAPNSDESNRPAADTALSKFSLDRDGQKLIPYIKAALAVKSDIRFWASPWTPPVWMKTGYMKVSGVDRKSAAKKPSYYDGGSMKNDAALLTAYAQYYTKFVQGYKDQGIKIDIVSPQNEPGYDQNYPSCLWDSATYVSWVKTLGQAMSTIGVKLMLGSLSNDGNNGYNDINIATAVLADATAKGFLSVVGAQWGVLDKVIAGTTFGGLPIWASEHKCGNYPWNPSGFPAYNSTQAPNDQAYGVESWGYIRDAIKKGKVTAYNAWNMVLDKSGLGIDTTRDWKQDALLVADSGNVSPTPAYYVFRHLSQYVVPGATVVGTTGGDAVAFKNSDGSLVAVMYNSGAANSSYVVSIGGKKLQFAMPAAGWATVKYKP